MRQKPTPAEKRKHTIYFPAVLLEEIGNEATRQDRSLSWIVQKAWKLAREKIMGHGSTGRPKIRPEAGLPIEGRVGDGNPRRDCVDQMP
jgi:uncharacterized small protein (TIGR04563 family)